MCLTLIPGFVAAEEVSFIDIPIKNQKSENGYEIRRIQIIEPHKLVDALITKVGVDIPRARVHEYWRVHRDELKEDWAVASPASREHIPFAFYGDSAKIHDDGTKIAGVFISFPAVWRPKSARNGRWCVFALEEQKLFGHKTMHCVLQRLVYSANLLFHGVDPEDNSRLLANGRKFVVTELKGDWQWHKLTMRFISSWTNLKSVCFLCDAKGRSANDPGMLYYSLDENPKWNHYDLQGFLANQMVGVVDPCFSARTAEGLISSDIWTVASLPSNSLVPTQVLPFSEALSFCFMAFTRQSSSHAACMQSTLAYYMTSMDRV